MLNQTHPLKTEWKFWVIQLKWEGRTKQFDIEPIFTCNTVETFWNNFIQFPPVNELKKGGISLFKSSIKPAWEDPQNAGGQSVTIALTEWTQEYWEKLILMIVGGTLEERFPQPFFCGMYAKVNSVGLSAALWFGPGELDTKALAEVLEIDPSVLQVKAHPTNN